MKLIRNISSIVEISSEVKNRCLFARDISVEVHKGFDELTETEFPEIKVAFWDDLDNAHVKFNLTLGETYALGNELLHAYLEGAAQASNAWTKVSMANHIFLARGVPVFWPRGELRSGEYEAQFFGSGTSAARCRG